jgi:hypothetical protein
MRDMLSTPWLWIDIKGPKNTIQGDTKAIQVDYSNNESIKHALTGVDVIIGTISEKALDVQPKFVRD